MAWKQVRARVPSIDATVAMIVWYEDTNLGVRWGGKFRLPNDVNSSVLTTSPTVRVETETGEATAICVHTVKNFIVAEFTGSDNLPDAFRK